MSLKEVVEVGRIETRYSSALVDDDLLCRATHLFMHEVIAEKWQPYKEYFIRFTLQGNQHLTLVFAEEEFKKFVKLLNEVVSRG